MILPFLISITAVYSINSIRYGNQDLCPDMTIPQKTSNSVPKLCKNDSDCNKGYNCVPTSHTHFGKILNYCCQTRESICSLPPNPGYGDCFIQPQTRYYFDTTELKCKSFKYIECLGGNQNQFNTVQECIKFCQSTACKAGENLLLSPSNTPVICANKDVCPDGHRCVYDQLFRRHVCCGMTRQEVCPQSTLSFAAPPSFKPLACEHSTTSDGCPHDFVCTGQSKIGHCCTPQYGTCSLGQTAYLHPLTKRSMKCDPMRVLADCPTDYHCSSAVPGASWGFCCSDKVTAECPEGTEAYLESTSKQPVQCTVGVTTCSIGYSCQSKNRNIIGFCCSKLNKNSQLAHSPSIKYEKLVKKIEVDLMDNSHYSSDVIDDVSGIRHEKRIIDYQFEIDHMKEDMDWNKIKYSNKKTNTYSILLNTLKCPNNGETLFYEGTQLARECTPVAGLNNFCPDEAECVPAFQDIHGRSVCCILSKETTMKPRITVPTTKKTKSFVYMVTSKTIPMKTERTSDPFCPTIVSNKRCKLSKKSSDCREPGFFCQYNIQLREYRCCSMEVEGI